MNRRLYLILVIVVSVLLTLSALRFAHQLKRSRSVPALSRDAQRTLGRAKLEYASERERFREWLRELVRYRTVSSESGNDAAFLACAQRLEELARTQVGCQVTRIVQRQGRRPAVLAQCTLGRSSERSVLPQAPFTSSERARAILFYGHYDVQPADAEKDGWTMTGDAFDPVEFDGRIYARGVSDDKAGVTALLAALSVLRQRLAIEVEEQNSAPMRPLMVKLLLEGEEEIGSPGLEVLLEQHQDLLFSVQCEEDEAAASCKNASIEFIVSVDGGQVDDRTGSLLLGMRGAAAFQVKVQGPQNDVHSGAWGGAVPNPLQGLAGLLASLHHSGNGSVAIPGFYAGIPDQNWSGIPSTDALVLREAARILPSERAAAQRLGLQRLGGGEYALFPSYLARLWFRPTLEIVGLGGGYAGEGIRGAIPAQALAKVLMRLIPGQDPQRIASAFCNSVQEYARKHLEPRGLRCSCHNLSFFAKPFVSSPDDRLHSLLRATLLTEYGSRVIAVHSGASIPALSLLHEHANRRTRHNHHYSAPIPVGVLAFSLPSDQIHGPDEHFSWSRFDRAVHSYLHLLLRAREAPPAMAPLPIAHSKAV
ncbi:hypothetical protein CCYA_CCYA12G3302 [Cyanidiococcus yangmingshanensis]|nr:hypothetical protein CCYA_CCYA12G3302 [Cyanidiococcus yangmingshanensis]